MTPENETRWLERLYRTAPIGLACMDTELRYVHINESLAAMNGIPRDAHIGRRFGEVLPDVAPKVAAKMRRVLETGESVLEDITDVTTPAHPHEERTYQAHYFPVLSDQGEIVGVSCAVQDITETKRTQENLLERENRLRSILESATDGMIVINSSGVIETVNPATLRLFGYDEAELIGKNVKILMPQPYRSQHDEYLRRYAETGERSVIGIGREIVCLRKDGSTLPAELSVSESSIGNDRHVFTGTLRDLSERKEAEAQLREREREIIHFARLTTMGEMAAGLAHELNQPLGAISNFASNCSYLLDSGDTQGLRADLQEITAITRRCGDIIRRIRRFVKKREPSREVTRVAEVVDDVLAFIRRDARLHNVEVHYDGAEAPLTMFVDAVQIEQLLLNLARNGIDAIMRSTRAQKVLDIKVAGQSDENVQITVQDSGDGIPPSIRHRICDPLYSTKSDGLGMGLAICQSIVEVHRGSMEISAGPDGGTLVRVTLPTSNENQHES